MKQLLLLAIGLLTLSAGVFARGRPDVDPAKRARKQTDRLDERLDLDDQQESAIYAINLRYAEQRKAMDRGGDRKAMKQQLRTSIEAQDKEIDAELSRKQRKAYADMKEERREQMRGRRGERGKRGGRGEGGR